MVHGADAQSTQPTAETLDGNRKLVVAWPRERAAKDIATALTVILGQPRDGSSISYAAFEGNQRRRCCPGWCSGWLRKRGQAALARVTATQTTRRSFDSRGCDLALRRTPPDTAAERCPALPAARRTRAARCRSIAALQRAHSDARFAFHPAQHPTTARAQRQTAALARQPADEPRDAAASEDATVQPNTPTFTQRALANETGASGKS